MFRNTILSVVFIAIALNVNMALADDNAIAKAHHSIMQQLKQAHDRYRQHKSEYNAGYLKGLEQAQVVLSMYAQATNREEAKASLRQALKAREKQKQRPKRHSCEYSPNAGESRDQKDAAVITQLMGQARAEARM